MIIADILIAFLTASLLTLLLIYGFKRRGPGETFLPFFLLLFLLIWAGGVWMTPVGPPVLGFYWLSFLVIGIIMALIVVSLLPPAQSVVNLETKEELKQERRADLRIGIFFWVFILFLVGAIASHYILIT